VDALVRRLDVAARPDEGFVTASLEILLPAARRARRQDASAVGRLRRDVAAAVRLGPSWTRPATFARAFALVLIALVLLALLILVVGTRRHVPPPFGPAANGQIAYVDRGQIYLASADGTHPRQITFAGHDSDPTFSRDGTRLAWRRFHAGGDPEVADAVLADADGANVIVIARDVKGLSHIAWSPDGGSVAFSGSIAGGPGSGWIAPADGSERPHAFTSMAGAWDPTWSPDGTRLAIGADPGVLWVMDRDGGNPRRLNHRTFTEIGERGEIAEWSPDGTRLLFTAFTGDGNSDFQQEVFVVGLDGSPETIVSPDAKRARDAVWSPDGTRIAYMRTGIGLGPIAWISDPSGANFQKLPGYYGWYQPIWSPDGSKLVVTDDKPGPDNLSGPAVRVILDIAGKAPPIVIPAPGVTADDLPDWSASWQRLAP
jgi:Tol biopolymer transport system component